MAYVPGCTFDLFISYASNDNQDRWVEQFEKKLGQELSELLGRPFIPKDSVFFDKRDLQVAQSFPAELAAAARASAIIVPILSPGYLTSSWCDREKTEFFTTLSHGALPEDCLAPILIRPIEKTALGPLYRNAQALSFLSPDALTPYPAGSTEWNALVIRLAGQLKDALQKLRRKCKPIFVGRGSASERSEQLRAWCCAELERKHFRTVPEVLQSFDDRDAVLSHLQEASLAVHFLGGTDEAALDAMERSAAVCPGPTILYQPFEAVLTPDEKIWLSSFENELPAASGRYQRLAGKNDQELLALIDELLTQSAPPPPATPAQLQLALVCQELDLDAVRQLGESIRTLRSIQVEFPDFLGGRLNSMERLRRWRDFLTRGEALVFYQGMAAREALEPIYLKAEQDNRGAPRNWYLAPPDLENKRQKHPDALWNIEQIVNLIETRSARRT